MAQFIKCGVMRCDTNVEYCDHVNRACVSCEPFCKYTVNLQYCKTLCRDYYEAVIAKLTTDIPVPATPLSVNNIVSMTEASIDSTSHRRELYMSKIGLVFVLLLITVVVAMVCVIKVKRRANRASRSRRQDSFLNIQYGGDHGDGRDSEKEMSEICFHTYTPNWGCWLCAPCCFACPSSSNMPDKPTQNARNQSNTNLYSIARYSLHAQTSLENITEDDIVLLSDRRLNRRSRSCNIPDAQYTRLMQPEDTSILTVPLVLSPSNGELLSYRRYSGRLLARPTDQTRDDSYYLPSAQRVQAPSSVVLHDDQSERRTDATVAVQSPLVADTAQNDPGQQVPRQDYPVSNYSQVPVPAHGQLPLRPHHSRPHQQVSSVAAPHQRTAIPATDHSQPAQLSMVAGGPLSSTTQPEFQTAAEDQSLSEAHYHPPVRVEYSSAMLTSVAPDPNAPPSIPPPGGPSSSLQRQQPGVPQPDGIESPPAVYHNSGDSTDMNESPPGPLLQSPVISGSDSTCTHKPVIMSDLPDYQGSECNRMASFSLNESFNLKSDPI